VLPSPAALAQVVTGGRFKRPRHLEAISDRLVELTTPDSRASRLIVAAPPRHGKSELISHYLPVWYLERWPAKRVILCAYGAEFAESWGDKALNTTRTAVSDGLLRTRVRQDRASGSFWETEAGGYMKCVGVGGPLTGRGADLMVLDDPIKNAEEAHSETYREKLWNWWLTTAYTRLEPGGVVVLTMTRWHEDDLAGRLLEQQADPWDVLDLPAIAEEDDPLGRREGEALWPERYPVEDLEVKRRADARTFDSLYQQHPTPEGGAVFRRDDFRFFRIREDHYDLVGVGAEPSRRVPIAQCWIAQTVDTAQKVKTVNDWTVLLTFVVGPGFLGFLRVERDRIPVPEQYAWITSRRGEARFQAVEDKSSGIGLIQQAANEGRPFRILKADVDKVTRAQSLAIAYQNRMVHHLADAPWVGAFERELLSFPDGKFDDQVDCAAYAGQLMAELGTGSALPLDLRVSSEDDDWFEDSRDRPRTFEDELAAAYGSF